MSDVILKVENLSKQYRLGTVGAETISEDINRWWYKIRGKEDPYLKTGETNDRSKKGESYYAWALRDINFEVKCGEVLGIIGKNGAGKSTLLKILSRVTSPTSGEIKTKGRIASLLEVGTGFHPELTGRENIYLNGAILGMTKAEIKGKEQEIIEFSGCQRYIDTPVKRYSSGMRVRLAFAVAAHLEPDILVVDEVLAVGDAEFQKKAIGKMQDISKGEGRTVIFVSHSMTAVKSFCNRSFVLENGTIVYHGDTSNAIDFYLSTQSNNIKNDSIVTIKKGKRCFISKVSILDELGKPSNVIKFKEPITFEIKVTNLFKNVTKTIPVICVDSLSNDFRVFTSSSDQSKIVYDLNQEENTIITKINNNILMPGEYKVKIALRTNYSNEIIDQVVDVLKFSIVPIGRCNKKIILNKGIVDLSTEWF
jgi:lipopolysaccharide transport system ATP-binding protein